MPRKTATFSQLRELSKLQVSEKEAAGFLGMRLKTFQEMLRVDERARAAWDEGREQGKISIRRKQFKLADTSAPMAIWLGKQYLAQNDISVVEHSGRDGGPISTLDLTKLTPDQRKNLREALVTAKVKR